MSYSIIRVSRVESGTNTTGIQKHVQRENNNYENEDIDNSKTHLNYDLVNDNKQKFNNVINENIEYKYTAKTKTSTDSFNHANALNISDNVSVKNQTPENTTLYCVKRKEFLERVY